MADFDNMNMDPGDGDGTAPPPPPSGFVSMQTGQVNSNVPPPPSGFVPIQQPNPNKALGPLGIRGTSSFQHQTPTPAVSRTAAKPTGAIIEADPHPSWDLVHHDPGESMGMQALKDIGGVIEGGGESLADTVAGTADIVNKVTGGVIPKSVTDTLHAAAGQNGGVADNAHKVGYAGETLLEFLMGDEAIKGLSLADRLQKSAVVAKALENSPRVMKAIQLGANISKVTAELGPEEQALIKKYPVVARLVGAGMDAIRAGFTQGVQTTVRTGGNVGQGLTDAAVMTGTAGLVGGATGVAGGVLNKLGDAASKTKNLATLAEGAASKQEVAEKLGQRIDASKDALHEGYESGISNLQTRLGDTTVSAQQNPLSDRAKQVLAEPDPEEHPLVAQAKQVAGDRLDKPVKNLIDAISTGKLAGNSGAIETVPSGLVDAQGKLIPTMPTVSQPKLAPPYQLDDLIQLRQTIRKVADGYDYGDINSRALRQLLPAVDDTIGKLAEQSGDASAVSDYQALRANYRDKIGLYDDPVIQKIRDGKVDDAARDFVGTVRQGAALPSAGKVGYNTDVLRGIIGDDGMKAFGKDVFGTILKDSTSNGRFNPEKFVNTWNRITPETKTGLFDINNANNGLQTLTKDAQSAVTLQKVTKGIAGAGMAGAVGTGLLSHSGFGLLSAVGLLSAEGGSIAAGRELLSYIATHPRVLSGYETAAKVANSPIAKGTAKAASIGAGKTAASVFSGLSGSLAGTGQQQ